MLRLVPLLARRAAELPRFHVRAQRRYTPGYGADLELEPLAWRDTRAGDIPYDLEPDAVPREERAPKARLGIDITDAAAVARMRAIADRLGAMPELITDTQVEALDDLRGFLVLPGAQGADGAAASLAALIEALDEGEHGISVQDAASLADPLYELVDYGLSEPIEALRATGALSVGREDAEIY